MQKIDLVIKSNFEGLVASCELLYENMEDSFMGPLPTDKYCFSFIILGSFACELGLKRKLDELNISYNKVHKVRELFDLLPEDKKVEIIEKAKVSGGRFKLKDDNEFYKNIDIISNNFVDWRYMHEEKPNISHADPNNPNRKYINNVSSSPVFIRMLYKSLS